MVKKNLNQQDKNYIFYFAQKYCIVNTWYFKKKIIKIKWESGYKEWKNHSVKFLGKFLF